MLQRLRGRAVRFPRQEMLRANLSGSTARLNAQSVGPSKSLLYEILAHVAGVALVSAFWRTPGSFVTPFFVAAALRRPSRIFDLLAR